MNYKEILILTLKLYGFSKMNNDADVSITRNTVHYNYMHIFFCDNHFRLTATNDLKINNTTCDTHEYMTNDYNFETIKKVIFELEYDWFLKNIDKSLTKALNLFNRKNKIKMLLDYEL